MFEDWATFYDALYRKKGKQYAREVEFLRGQIVRPTRLDRPLRLLDVACGTGEHLKHFAKERPNVFDVCGIDQSSAMLEVARKKLPGVPFWKDDMTTFELTQQWRPLDVVTCLFSSIGYLQSVEQLHSALRRMAAHLSADGVVLIEPAVLPERLVAPEVSILEIEFGSQLIQRTTQAQLEGRTLKITFDYELEPLSVVGAERPVSAERGSSPRLHFSEQHEVFLFTLAEYESAFQAAALSFEFDPVGPSGLGLLLGRAQS